jgi:hypothetical protein
MSEKDNHQGSEPALRRARCGYCRLPLVQLYQGDLLYTLQNGQRGDTSQLVPAYAYRVLTDPTPLLFCPRCNTTLSPATVMMVNSETLITEEGKTVKRTNLS